MGIIMIFEYLLFSVLTIGIELSNEFQPPPEPITISAVKHKIYKENHGSNLLRP